ncbi:MAG: tRNA adenosine(34) deaminase TadA [Nitrospirota bacterium]
MELTADRFPAMTDNDIAYMQLALEAAKRAPAIGEVPIGAVLVRDGQVLAQAHNLREVWQDPTAHAEVVAIREAATRSGTWRLTGTTLYVTVEPCAMCIGAVILSRIDRLIFGAKDPKAGACGSIFNLPDERRLNHRVEVVGGVLEQESQDLLQAFFRGLRENVEERTRQ